MSRSTRLTTRQVNEYLQEQEDGDYYFDGRTLCPNFEDYEGDVGFDEDFGDELDDEEQRRLDDVEIAEWEESREWEPDDYDPDDDYYDIMDEPGGSELNCLSAAEILALDVAIASLPSFEPTVLETLPEGISEEQQVEMYDYRGAAVGLQTGGIWSCCALMLSYEGVNFIAHVVSDSSSGEVREALVAALGVERLARMKADKESFIYLVPGVQYGEFARRLCYYLLDSMGLAGQARIFRGVFPMELVGISASGPFLVRPKEQFVSYSAMVERAWQKGRMEELMALQDADVLDEALYSELLELLLVEIGELSEAESQPPQP